MQGAFPRETALANSILPHALPGAPELNRLRNHLAMVDWRDRQAACAKTGHVATRPAKSFL
jgi:hypothetical protein